MWQMGVWERDEGLAEQLAPLGRGSAAFLRAGCHPAQLSGRVFDLLVVSPRAAGWAGAGAIACRTALVPGGMACLTRLLPCERAVSYGTGSANTLTLSSWSEHRAAVAVQRAFSSLSGQLIEQQELVLPCGSLSPELLLARVGAELLLRGEPITDTTPP